MSPLCNVIFSGTNNSLPSKADSLKWAKDVISNIHSLASLEKEPAHQKPFLPNLTVVIKDGDATLSVDPQHSNPFNLSNISSQYPAHFRIPPATLRGLPMEDCINRARNFALGCLVFRLIEGRLPFTALDETCVQTSFEKGLYPPEIMESPLDVAVDVLGLWSKEFAQAMEERARLRDAESTPLSSGQSTPTSSGQSTPPPPGQSTPPSPGEPGIVGISSPQRPNRGPNGLLVAGLVICGAASLVVPALGVVGFSALGPGAGTLAATWQGSIGLVQAGSFFAWCQSAAMGGAAVGAISAAQGVGAGVAGLGLLKAMLGSDDEDEIRRMLWSLFVELVRRVGG